MTGQATRWEIEVTMTVPCGLRQFRPLSANDHWHRLTLAPHIAQIRRDVAWRAKALHIPPQQHITVGLHYAPGDNRRRDASNLMACQKPAVDGLVDAGVVPDDTALWVTERMPIIRHPGPTDFTRWLVLVVRVTPRPETEETPK
jgi:crossover junction endodeoxyribonuclease RusA